jgi:hypothetical protein
MVLVDNFVLFSALCLILPMFLLRFDSCCLEIRQIAVLRLLVRTLVDFVFEYSGNSPFVTAEFTGWTLAWTASERDRLQRAISFFGMFRPLARVLILSSFHVARV